MLLAAEDHNGPDGAERCEVLDASGIPTGTRVMLEGITSGESSGALDSSLPEEITVDTFFNIPIRVVDHVAASGGRALTLDGKPIKTAVIANAEVH
jgi:hypothetical protein